jgi:N-methylhydantoinase B
MAAMESGNVLFSSGVGGGGYGDPLDREPELVIIDYRNGLVTEAAVREIYGVSINYEKGIVDLFDTKKIRDTMRESRLSSAKRPRKNLGLGEEETPLNRHDSVRVNDYLTMRTGASSGRKYIACTCGKLLSPANENYKDYCLLLENPIQKAGPQVNPHHIGGDRFVFREYFCPSCGVLFDTEVSLRGAPLLWDTLLSI